MILNFHSADPPAIVTINGSTEARVGDIIPLSCTTGASNPPASIKWLIDGKQVENSESRTLVSSDNGWITYSNTTVIVEPNKTSVVAICYGVNAHLNENKVATHTITVLCKYNRVSLFSLFLFVSSYKECNTKYDI